MYADYDCVGALRMAWDGNSQRKMVNTSGWVAGRAQSSTVGRLSGSLGVHYSGKIGNSSKVIDISAKNET